MKVCFVTCAYSPIHRGGVGDSLSSLAQEYIKLGHEVVVFTIEDNVNSPRYHERSRVYDGVLCQIVNLPGSMTNFFGRYMTNDYYNKKIERLFESFVKEENVSLVHFHAIQKMGANLLNTTNRQAIATVVTFHDFWWVCSNLFYTDLEYNNCNQDCLHCHSQLKNISAEYKTAPEFYAKRNSYLAGQIIKADVVISNSHFLKNEISKWNIFKNIIVVENGVDEYTDHFGKRVGAKSKNGNINIGFLGGTSELKGYDVVINAFDMLGDSEPLQLSIYGVNKISRKSLWNSWRGFRRNNSLFSLPRKLLENRRNKRLVDQNPRVRLYPSFSKDEKYKILQSMDLVIVGTRVMESFSLVTREALLMNIPVIASDSGGPQDVIEDGVNGYIYSRNSPKDLCQTILRAKRDLLSDDNFNISKSIKTISQQALEHLEIYHTLLK